MLIPNPNPEGNIIRPQMPNIVDFTKEENSFKNRVVEAWYSDPSSRTALKKVVYDHLMENPFVSSLPLEIQMQALFSRAKFANSENEQDEVAAMFMSYQNSLDFPSLEEPLTEDFSAKYLVATSLFEEYMKKLEGMVSWFNPNFYKERAIAGFEKAKKYDVALHFDFWKNYAAETLKPAVFNL